MPGENRVLGKCHTSFHTNVIWRTSRTTCNNDDKKPSCR